MRIIHVVQGLGVGGQERLVMHLSRELIARGHEPAIVSLSPGGEVRAEAGDVPVYDATRGNGVDPSLVARLTALLVKLRADVVHTHNPAPMLHAIPAALLARVRRRVHTKHGANIYGRRGLWVARAVAWSLDALVAVSPETAEAAKVKERPSSRRLHIVPNGIPLFAFGPDRGARTRVRAELGIPPSSFVIGSVGRLAPEKDYPLLVHALSPLLSDEVRLVLVGSGGERGVIERSIPSDLARFVVFTGLRHDIPALLASFDVFALSSRTEGLPLAIPEAMASALPIVATAVGGIPSAVPADCGLLVPSGDAPALRRAVEVLRADRDRAEAMGASGQRHAHAHFSIERMTDAYERIYRGGA
jgi:glycosyltransferase involved in cell wall biosynthesis